MKIAVRLMLCDCRGLTHLLSTRGGARFACIYNKCVKTNFTFKRATQKLIYKIDQRLMEICCNQ